MSECLYAASVCSLAAPAHADVLLKQAAQRVEPTCAGPTIVACSKAPPASIKCDSSAAGLKQLCTNFSVHCNQVKQPEVEALDRHRRNVHSSHLK